MNKLITYTFLTLDGYFQGPHADTSWHQHGKEENEYSEHMLALGNTLLFGRVTYEMMAGFWPTHHAADLYPIVARGMNAADKVVFSNTLRTADWSNTRVLNGDMVETVRAMKRTNGRDMALLGSGSVLAQLAEHNLVDEYQIMIDPVAIGQGTPIFHGITRRLNLKLVDTRTFGSGVVLLRYRPDGQ